MKKNLHLNSSSTSASSPTNPDINRFLVRQRPITEPGIENVAVPVTEEAESFVSGCVDTAVAAAAAAAAVAFFATVVFDELVDEVDVFTGEAFGTVAFMPVVDAFGGGAPDAASGEVALFPGIVEGDAAVGGAVDGDDGACSIDFTGRSAESAAIAGGAALLT